MRWFRSASDEKDARIQDLKNEIAFLRSMLAGYHVSNTPSLSSVEANTLLDGAGSDQVTLDVKLDPAVEAERIALLSGNY